MSRSTISLPFESKEYVSQLSICRSFEESQEIEFLPAIWAMPASDYDYGRDVRLQAATETAAQDNNIT